MKSFQPLLIALCFYITWPQTSYAQWVRQYPLEKLEDVLDLDVSADGYGFAAGTNDLMLRLDNASKTWELLPGYGQNWRFESVDYLDGSNGNVAVIGGQGLILTVDGGDHWTEIPDAPAGVHTLRIYSTTHLIAIGDEGAFVWRNNEWTDLMLPVATGIKGAFILDSLHMWVYTFATNPAIYYTTDGGNQWNTNLDISDTDVVRFYNASYGIATDGRDVYHSTNGGVNWTLTGDNAIANTVNDLVFGSSASVLIGATLNAEPALSLDSGKTWTALDPGLINQRSYSVVALSDNEFWVGNDLSSIIHTENTGTSWLEKSGPERNLINDIFFLTRSLGFALGQGGMLLRTFDGGNNWNDISFGTRNYLTLHGLTASDLWMGANQRILHSTDTGSTWTENLVLVGSNINDILALSSERILAVTTSGVILRTDDGGADWDTMYNSGGQLRSIAKIDDQRLMATGFNGVILRSDNQGETWSPLTAPEAGLQYEQAFFLDTTGWLVTSSFKHTMWKTNNAGNSWTPITLPVDRFWDGVYFITQDTGIVVARSTNEGRAYITFTGGQTWSAGHVLTFPLFGVAGVPNPNGTAWIYGYGSDIEVLPYCNTFPAISNFEGNLFPCEGDTSSYSVSAENVDLFNWQFPSSWQIIGNANNDTVVVKPGTNSGFITVSGSNACGETGQLNFSAGPILMPEVFSISGEIFPCVGDIVTYIAFENHSDVFMWSIPSDWGIIGSNNQSSIMVQVGSTPGSVSVIGSNTCGTTESVSYPVEPQSVPTAILVSGDLTPCPGDTVRYEFGDIDISNSFLISNVTGLDDWSFLNGTIPYLVQAIAGFTSGSLQISILNDCGASMPYTLQINTESIPVIETFFNESSGLLTLSGTGNQYQWYFNGQPIPGATNASYTATQNGSYYAEVVLANGCTAASEVVNITTVATIQPVKSKLRIYPVPATMNIFIEGISGQYNFSIYDLTGRLVNHGKKSESIIGIADLQKGYYLLNITNGNNTYTSGFIKE